MSALDDLIAKDAGGAAAGSALEAVIARDGGSSAPAAQAAPDTSPWGHLARQIGLTARMGVTGLTGLPTMAGDALNSGVNLVTGGINSLAGTNIPALRMPSQVVQQTMDAAGLPQPQNALERGVQDVGSAAVGVGPFVGAGKLLAKTASPVIQAAGRGMSAMPGMQMVGAAGAAAAGDAAKEDGAGPFGQMAAGLGGGLAGALAPSALLALGRGAKGLASNISGAVTPILAPRDYVGRQLAQTLGPDASIAADNIRSAQQFVPGSLPTTAQAAGGPVLVATEKALANSSPDFKTALATRGASNNAARWSVLDSVARTPQDIEDAIAARQAITSPMYAAAHAQIAPITPDLTELAARPAMKQAMQSADLLAKNEGVPLQWPTPENPAISGKALDYTNRALGDLIGNAQSSNQPELVKALTGAQKQLQAWTSKNIPGVKEASADYAALSSPINTMQAGQQIAANLGTRALDGGVNPLPLLQLSPYRTALTQALNKQQYGIDEGAKQSLQGIGQDLQRATISNSLRSPGSDTAYNAAANGWLARQLYGQNFGGASGLGRTLAAVTSTAAGHPWIGLGLQSQLNRPAQLASARLNQQLAEMLLNPSTLLPYLEAANGAQQPVQQSLLPMLRGNVSQGLLGAATAQRQSP